MYSIQVDFEVFKKLTSLRETETFSENDVLRRVLGLPESNGLKQAAQADGKGWTVKGVFFQEGTEFRSYHTGKPYLGRVENGCLVLEDGSKHTSPSSAAVAITGYAINGWKFWDCRFPGETSWRAVDDLRVTSTRMR